MWSFSLIFGRSMIRLNEIFDSIGTRTNKQTTNKQENYILVVEKPILVVGENETTLFMFIVIRTTITQKPS